MPIGRIVGVHALIIRQFSIFLHLDDEDCILLHGHFWLVPEFLFSYQSESNGGQTLRLENKSHTPSSSLGIVSG